jgi:uncharacterized phage protein gp47/JayE
MIFKRMSDIYSRLVDLTITNTSEVNDFSVGSAMRAIYEAFSIELEQFYILTRENILEAIEDGVYSSFGFIRKSAQKGYGNVQLTFNNALQTAMVIPRGSKFTCSQSVYPQVFETLTDYLVPQGSTTVQIQVFCTLPGTYGNVPANVINNVQTPLLNVRTITNPSSIQTGQDEEPINEMRARFQSYIKSISKATVPAIEYGVRSVSEVAGVYIDEQTGLITVYAHDRNGDLPNNVIAEINSILPNYRPAGIPVNVKAVTKTLVDVTVTVTLSNKSYNTSTFATQISNTISSYLNNMQVSQDLILSDLSSIIKYIDRTLIYDVSFALPTQNVVTAGSQIIRAGSIMVLLA